MVITLTLLTFAVALYLVSLQLRRQVREQIAGRDARLFYAMTMMRQRLTEAEGATDGWLEDPRNQVALVLKVSDLLPDYDVLGIRLFNPAGRYVGSFSTNLTAAELDGPDVLELQELRTVSHFRPAYRLGENFADAPRADQTDPVLELLMPIHRDGDPRLLGIAQLLVPWASIAAEFAQLDKHLFGQAAVVFWIGGAFIVISLGWAFRRLEKGNRLLAARTADLLRANHELTLAAKSSAVGSVAAHLIHGLKNPLSGLQNFMDSRSHDGGGDSDTDWQLAVSTTRRMQSLISEVVRVLGEENRACDYEVSLEELVGMLAAKAEPCARHAGVQFEIRRTAEATLANRDANLILLILDILLQNAFQATPPGRLVRVSLRQAGEKVVCEVQDQGRGIPESLRESLFTPCQTTKEGGTGIGLAIAKQLAAHIGAELELTRSAADGCLFSLSLPDKPAVVMPDGLDAAILDR